MRNSKVLRRVTAAICLVVYLVVAESTLAYLLESESWSMNYNYEVKQLEEENADVDMIFIGASRVLRTFEPGIFEEELGLSNVLNAGTSLQRFSGTYYHLKYLLTKFEPKYVVLGVTWNRILEREDTTQSELIVKDRMGDFSLLKLEYESAVFSRDEIPYLLNSYRYRYNLNIDAISKNLLLRRKLKNNNYIDSDSKSGSYYAGKGFVYSHSSVPYGNAPMNENRKFAIDNIDEESLEYLIKVTELCKEKGIKLYLVSAPLTVSSMYTISNYQGAVEYYENYAKENGLVYHNLNYLKDRELFLTDSYMHDKNHINGEGAKIISQMYAEILKKDLAGEDTSGYFYRDIKEFSETVERIVGVRADIEQDDRKMNVRVESAHNEDEIPEYEILLSVDSGEYSVLQEYSTKTEYSFELPECTKYTIRVNARRVGSEAEYEAYQEYEY